MTATGDGTHGPGGLDEGPAGWAAAEARAGRRAQRVVLGLGVAVWAATVALGVRGLAAPLLLGFAQAGGLSVSGAV